MNQADRQMRALDALNIIRDLHSDSGVKVEHWCSLSGGSMEPSHDIAAPNYCNECGTETPWPCPTYKAANIKVDA